VCGAPYALVNDAKKAWMFASADHAVLWLTRIVGDAYASHGWGIVPEHECVAIILATGGDTR
jgi:hypothetical protein